MTTPSKPIKTADFRDLRVWRAAVDFATEVYRVTREFPLDERFGLTSQLRRATISISANIAEGNARFSRPEYRHFVSIARGSTAEVQTQLIIAGRLGYLAESGLRDLAKKADDISKMLVRLHRSLE